MAGGEGGGGREVREGRGGRGGRRGRGGRGWEARVGSEGGRGREGVKKPLMLNLQTKRMDCIKSTIVMLMLPQSETAFTKHATNSGNQRHTSYSSDSQLWDIYSDRH